MAVPGRLECFHVCRWRGYRLPPDMHKALGLRKKSLLCVLGSNKISVAISIAISLWRIRPV